jgi:hypothetical protein
MLSTLTCPIFFAIFAFTLLASHSVHTEQRDGGPPQPAVTSPRISLPSEFEMLLTRYHFENDGTGRKEVIAKIRILNEMGTLARVHRWFPLLRTLGHDH